MTFRTFYPARQSPLRQRLAFFAPQNHDRKIFLDLAPSSTRAQTRIRLLATPKRCLLGSTYKEKGIKRSTATKASQGNGFPPSLEPKWKILMSVEEDLSLTRSPLLDNPDGPSRDAAGNVGIQERAKYLYRLGRTYLGFYKTALKQVWASFKASRKFAGLSDRDLRMFENGSSSAQMKEEWQGSRLWNNIQFIRRSRHDARKLLPFGLMLMICGEFTPLIALAWRRLGSLIIPAACKIPLQVMQERKDILTRVHQYNQLPEGFKSGSFFSVESCTADQVIAKSELIGVSIKPKPLVRLIPFGWLLRIYKLRLSSWCDQTMAEVNLLGLINLKSLPTEEIVHMCFSIGHVDSPEKSPLGQLVRNVKIDDSSEVTSFDLDTSEENLENVRCLLQGHFERLTTNKQFTIE